VSYDVFGKVLPAGKRQATRPTWAGGDGGASKQKPKDDVVDAEYEVVDDDKKQE
jgi:hypothetical protein